MPQMVDQLTPVELIIAEKVNQKFSASEQCAYYLTKTVRSIYQMDEAAVEDWRQELGAYADCELDARTSLIKAYTQILMVEQKYQFHLEYWLRHYQEHLIDEIEEFLSGLPPHLTNEWPTPTPGN